MRSVPSGFTPVSDIPGVSFQSRALHVGHPTSPPISSSSLRSPPRLVCPPPIVFGVGHPVQPLTLVRRADARSAQIGGPNRISHCFQVSSYSSEPFTSIRARNLLSKHDWRRALGDAVAKSGPKVPLVGFPFPFASDGERLAGARACPDWSVFGPPGVAEREAPSANPGEEVALCVSGEFIWVDVGDAAVVDYAWRDEAEFHQFPHPRAHLRVDVVVEVQRAFAFFPQSESAGDASRNSLTVSSNSCWSLFRLFDLPILVRRSADSVLQAALG